MTIRQEDEELKIIMAQQALAHAHNMVQPYLQSPKSSVDNFLKLRREEAEPEEQELQSNKSN